MESKAKRKYLEKHIHPLGVFETLNKSNVSNPSIVHPIAICIPIHNEFPHFFKTLRSVYLSLVQSLSYLKKDFVPTSIICCVNAKQNDSFEIQDNNEKLLRELARLQRTEFFENELMNIHLLNFSQKGFYFQKKDGVGLARKLSLDYALQGGGETLASLDADCLVSMNYIQSLELFYQNTKDTRTWALTGFFHRREESKNDAHKKAMDEYEDYLLSHSEFLFAVGSPYYPVALGPTIVVTSEAYVQSGGMNTKIAGEDFYFLQNLIKFDLKKKKEAYIFLAARVFPSDRLSKRVLFGTGTALEEIMAGGEKGFSKDKYETVKAFFLQFNTVTAVFYAKKNKEKMSNNRALLTNFEMQVKKTAPRVWLFLEEDRFWKDWKKIVLTHYKNKENLVKAFFERFDGLKTIRLFNYLDSF